VQKLVLDSYLFTRITLNRNTADNLLKIYEENKYFYPFYYGEENNKSKYRVSEHASNKIMDGFVYLEGRSAKWMSFIDNPPNEYRRNVNPFVCLNLKINETNRNTVFQLKNMINLLSVFLSCDYSFIEIRKEYPYEEQNPINLQQHLPGIYWLNYFGEAYIKLIGRDKLLTTPAYDVYELENSIVIQSCKDVESTISNDFNKVKKKIIKHIGVRYFYSGIFKKCKTPDFPLNK